MIYTGKLWRWASLQRGPAGEPGREIDDLKMNEGVLWKQHLSLWKL
jgi:hypothetical protein